MKLLKTSALALAATMIRVISELIVNKFVSVLLGPAGLATVAQFRNFVRVAMDVAQGATTIGVTKYSAEYGKEDARLPKLFSSATKIALLGSVLIGLLITVFSTPLSIWLLGSTDFKYLFIIFGFLLVFFVLNNLLLSMMHGLKEINRYISINIMQSIYFLASTPLLIYLFGINGALIAIATSPAVAFLIVLYKVRKHKTICFLNLTRRFDNQEAKKLMKFSAMSLSSAALVSVTLIFVRNYITTELGEDQVGYWQGMWYISTAHVMVLASTITIYYLPRISEITDVHELKPQIVLVAKLLVPAIILSSVIAYVAKDYIIVLLYSSEFMPMAKLFGWQLAGDCVKLVSLLYALVITTRGLVFKYILSEVLSHATFYLLIVVLVSTNGLIGTSVAYFVTNCLYLVLMVWLVKQETNTKQLIN